MTKEQQRKDLRATLEAAKVTSFAVVADQALQVLNQLEEAERERDQARAAAEKLADHYGDASEVRDSATNFERCYHCGLYESEVRGVGSKGNYTPSCQTCTACILQWAYSGAPPVNEAERMLDALEGQVIGPRMRKGAVNGYMITPSDTGPIIEGDTLRDLARALLAQAEKEDAPAPERHYADKPEFIGRQLLRQEFASCAD